MSSIRTTSRLLRVYADKDAWRRDHDEAQSCLDVEEQIAWGVHLFRGMLGLEARSQVRALKERDPRAGQLLDLMPVLYQSWTDASEFYLGRALEFVARGYEVEGLDDFQQAVDEARCLVGNANFEEQIRPIEELTALANPDNPRPDRYLD